MERPTWVWSVRSLSPKFLNKGIKMAKCKHCDSKRIFSISAHSSDLNFVEVKHLRYEHDGYAPYIKGICGGDDVDISVCLDCFRIKGMRPMSDEELLKALDGDDDGDDDDDD